MDILSALKDRDRCITVSCHPDKWLAYNEVTRDYEVYYRPYRTRKTQVLISTPGFEEALDKLMEEK
jgi:hypothetical protein